MEKKHFGITPERKVYGVLSHVGYSLKDSIAELIDNSIDGRMAKKPLKIEIVYDKQKNSLTISDNGTGIPEKDLRNALTLAATKKNQSNVKQLGFFGIGLKSAALSMGDTFEVITKQINSTQQYSFEFDRKEFELHGDWESHPYNVDEGHPVSEHGTKIIITNLKPNLISGPKLTRLMDSFSMRYEQFFQTENVELWIQGDLCELIEPKYLMHEHISLKTKYGVIEASLGLNAKRSAKGAEHGFHLYKEGRLINSFSKLGMGGGHVEKSLLTGAINLDFVPVVFNKSTFIVDSPEYLEADETLTKYLKPMWAFFSTRYIKKKSNIIEAIFKEQDKTGKILNFSEYKKYVVEYSGRASIDSESKLEQLKTSINSTSFSEQHKQIQTGELFPVNAESGKIIKSDIFKAIKGARELEDEINTTIKKTDIVLGVTEDLFLEQKKQFFKVRKQAFFFKYLFVKSNNNYFLDYDFKDEELTILINMNFPLFEQNLKDSKFFVMKLISDVIASFINKELSSENVTDCDLIRDHILKLITKGVMKSQMDKL